MPVPFYRGGNRGSEKPDGWPKATQPVSSGAEIPAPAPELALVLLMLRDMEPNSAWLETIRGFSGLRELTAQKWALGWA